MAVLTVVVEAPEIRDLILQGEYIGLVDSDDYVASNMYELLYNEAKRGDYDIVDCGYYREAKDEARIYTSDELTGELDDNKRKALIRGGGYLTTKIFKKELWNDPPIRMREKVKCLEDTEILIYMFLRERNIGNVKEVLYNYCNSEGSTSKTRDLDEYFNSVYGAMGAVYEVCRNRPEYAGCQEMIEYAMARMYSYGINRCIYDRIVEYGASPDNVKSFFDSLGEKEVKMLNKLAELRHGDWHQGFEKGIEKGADKINKLNQILIDSGRLDDLKRATNDKEFQNKLISELIPKET